MAWTTPGTATAGEVLTAAFWNTNVRDNTAALRDLAHPIAFATTTADYTITATSVASAADIFTSDVTFTAVSGKYYKFEYYFYYAYAPSSNENYTLYLVNATGTELASVTLSRNTAGGLWVNWSGHFFYKPGSGSITVNMRATKTAGGDGTLEAVTTHPNFLAVYGPFDM